MTTPTTRTTPTTQATPETPAIPTPSRGYLAAVVGGVAGAAVLATGGVIAGLGLIPVLEDPNGGMENLGLLLIPLALGALGIIVGMAVGVRMGLRRGQHAHATATAWLTVPLGVIAMFAAAYLPVSVAALLVAVPAASRHVVVSNAGGRPAGRPTTPGPRGG